jgi:TonB-linked SusC/RagA family outer membrane protein
MHEKNKTHRYPLLLKIILSILLLSFPSLSNDLPAQTGGNEPVVVKGLVVDDANEPVIGASVSIKGTATGVITGPDGHFALPAPPKATLIVSYIGYNKAETPVTGAMPLKIVLHEDLLSLGEVVVVGYGTQKKATLTGAVTVVSDKMLQNKGSLASPLQAIQGQVPGVMITRSSSAPGDEGWDMKVRGAVSANTAAPLIIIDGVAFESANAMRNINSNDIESINFLKDAAAAIYGARAAGGVVLITTKRAEEGRPKIEYNGSYTHKLVGLQPHLMSMEQWADAVITARRNDGFGNTSDVWYRYAMTAKQYSGKYIDFDHSSNPIAGAFSDVMDLTFIDTNWSDVLFDDAGSTQHNLAVSGGTTGNAYRLSLGYLFDDSNLQWGNNSNNRYNIRLTNSIKVADWFDIESMLAFSRQDQVTPSKIGNTLSSSVPQPGLPAATADGKPYSWGTWLSPVWYAELGGDNRLKVSDVNISEQFNFHLMKDLDLISNLGYNTSNATRDIENLAIKSFNYAGTKENANVAVANQALTSYEKTASRRDFYSLSAYLNYKKSFNNVHNINLMAGTQYELTQYDYFGAKVLDIQASLDALNGAGTISLTNGKGEKYHEAVMACYSRLNYNYKSKYLLEGLLRYDGSSKFSSDNRWDLFWGISGGWILTEENFLKDNAVLNYLKFRVSYGVVGNQSGIDRYEGQQLYDFKTASGALLGDGKATTINTNGKIASKGREWERIYNYNAGLDFGLLQNRLSGSVDVFQKKNNNMLITVQYPGILGDNAGYSNLGKFEGKGLDGMLNWNDRIDRVRYRFGGTFTWFDNELTDIGATSVMAAGFRGQQQGYPLNSVFGYTYVGKITTPEQRQAYLAKYLTGNGIGLTDAIRIGDNMFEDTNNDGALDFNDLKWLGSNDPKVSYSFNFGVEWNGFDLSCIFQGAGQRTVFRAQDNPYTVPMRSVYMNMTTASLNNVWSPENPAGRYPPYTNTGTINAYNYIASDWTVEDGAYIRLKNVTLGYNLPEPVLKRTFLSRARIYVTGADLWEKTNIHEGWDPEATRDVSGVQRYPFVRTVTLGLNLTF